MIKDILKKYCIFIEWIIKTIGKSISIMMPILSLIVFYEVISRYLFNKPTIWGYDISLFLFAYISALGGAYAQQKKSHINVDILYSRLSKKIQCIFDIITGLFAIFFLCIMTKVCASMFLESLEYNYKTASEWAPSMHHFWLMITISSSIFILQYSTEIISNIYFFITGKELIPSDDKKESLNNNFNQKGLN